MKSLLGKLVPLVLIALVGGVVWWNPAEKQPGEVQTLNCPDLRQGCTTLLDGRSVKVSVVGELKPLEAFQVRLEAPGAEKVEARFTMEGMDMGFNLYTLRAQTPGVFQARVTLPVCVTGRRDWIMHLDLDGNVLEVPFVTDL